jgi:AAA family ATP:ADP antiporter
MASTGESSPTLGWRERLWPIRAYELKKVLPLLFMKFFISFTYGVLTSMKDAFVVTAKGAGAEVIPVLKGWIVLPIALGATILYSKLSNVFRRSTLFYGIILFFMSFIFFYGFILYPNIDSLSPHQSADWLLNKLGAQNGHWVAIYRNWIQTLFFVIAELWGSIVIFLLFWGFVNHICNFNEAKRCYNLFIAGGDMAQMFTGPLVCYFTGKFVGEHFHLALQNLVLIVLLFGAMIMLLHFLLTRKILKNDERLYQPESKSQPIELKTKLSLFESLKFIAKSPYLRAIAVMVVAYGLTMNLTEVTWKANLKLAYPETGAYQSVMATVSSSVGVCSFIITLFFSGLLIRTTGWHTSAQLPPIVIGTTSLLFLLFYLNPEWLSSFSFLGFSPLMLIVLFGAFQNITTKIMKYAFFDATKEMAYIPLDMESKVKGKAAIDVVGSRLGKSGAAWSSLLHIP